MTADYATEVTQLYEAIEYRAPDPADLATIVADLTTGVISTYGTVAGVQAAIESDAYTSLYVDPVIREYQAAFGRTPDQAGAAYWSAAFAANPAALAEMSTIFTNAPEFASLYHGATAATVGDTALVTALYENVLDRAPDQAGLTYWVGQHLTAAQLLQAFSQSAEFISDTAPEIIAYQNDEAAGNSLARSLFSYSGAVVYGDVTLYSDSPASGATVLVVELVGVTSLSAPDLVHPTGGSEVLSATTPLPISNVDSLTKDLDASFGSASPPNWTYAGGSPEASQVDVSAATSIGAALDIAASAAPGLDQRSDGGAHSIATPDGDAIAPSTGLVDWFQFGGDTYVVEVNNPTAAAAVQAGFAAPDLAVELAGVVDLNHVALT